MWLFICMFPIKTICQFVTMESANTILLLIDHAYDYDKDVTFMGLSLRSIWL